MTEIKTGLASEGGHWYQPDGAPAYQVPYANGEGFRATTLRDARKLGLYPSVTAITRMEAAPGLQKWLIEQHVLSALTLPVPEGVEHASPAHLKAIYADAQEQSRKARERGTQLHASIEAFMAGRDPAPGDGPFVEAVGKRLWEDFGEVSWQAERSFAHPSGYGGKCDLHGPGYVVDFKTKDFTDPSKVKGWPEQATQLAAYRRGLGLEGALCVNLFISTTVPGLIVTHIWDELDIVKGEAAFTALLQLWQVRNAYYPGAG